jgi:hypothetical protein
MDIEYRPIRNCYFHFVSKNKECTNPKCKFNHKPTTDFLRTFPATKPKEKEVGCGMWTAYEEQKRIELRLKGASEEELEELRINHTLKYINEHNLDELREGLLNLKLEKERLATEAGVQLTQLNLKFPNLYNVVGVTRKLAKNKKKTSATEVLQQPEIDTSSMDFTLPLTHDTNMSILIDAFTDAFGDECFNKLTQFSKEVADNFANIANKTAIPTFNNGKVEALALAIAQHMFQDYTEKKNSAELAGLPSKPIESFDWDDVIMDELERVASAKVIANKVKPKPTSYKNAL